MGNQSSKHHNSNQLDNSNNNNNNNKVDERVLNEMKESLDSDQKNGAENGNEEISKVPPIDSSVPVALENSGVNIVRSSDLPVGDSPVIIPNENNKNHQSNGLDASNLPPPPPPPVEINDDHHNTQLIVDNVNEELLSALKIEENHSIPPPPVDKEDSIPPPPPEEDDSTIPPPPPEEDNSTIPPPPPEEDDSIPPPPPPEEDDSIPPPPPEEDDSTIPPPPPPEEDDSTIPPPPPVTRERFQTKAEAELLSLFNNTPIVDITVTSNSTQQNEETIEEILAQNFFNDQTNYTYKEVPKNQKSKTLSRRIYNTLTRKKSRKAADGYSTMVNKSQTTGDIASLSKLDDNDGEGSSNSINNIRNSDGNINNNINSNSINNDRKYNTISMKMSTFRKKLFHSQQDLHSDSNINQQDQQNVTEASDANGKGTDDKKKKKFFSSTELSNLGSMFSREMGHVFLLSPSGPSYCSYTTSGF